MDRRQERLGDEPAVAVDRVGVPDPDAGQLGRLEPAGQVLPAAADQADVPQPAGRRAGGGGVDRLELPVDADEPGVGMVGGDVAQELPVGTADLAEDSAVEPAAELAFEPVGPRQAERAGGGDEVGELGQPVAVPAVAGRGGRGTGRVDR